MVYYWVVAYSLTLAPLVYNWCTGVPLVHNIVPLGGSLLSHTHTNYILGKYTPVKSQNITGWYKVQWL